MKRILRVTALVASAIVCAASIGAVAVAGMTYRQATTAFSSAEELRATRLELTQAQQQVGSSDLSDALAGAVAANEVAQRLRRSTARMIPLLRSADTAGAGTVEATKRTAAALRTIIRRARPASRVLRIIAREQSRSSQAAHVTNSFLRRILTALKKTNRSFPPT
jgi:hypothetical protein